MKTLNLIARLTKAIATTAILLPIAGFLLGTLFVVNQRAAVKVVRDVRRKHGI